jgi:hypothetical protein
MWKKGTNAGGDFPGANQTRNTRAFFDFRINIESGE